MLNESLKEHVALARPELDDVAAVVLRAVDHDPVPAGHRRVAVCCLRTYWRCLSKALRLASRARSIEMAISVP